MFVCSFVSQCRLNGLIDFSKWGQVSKISWWYIYNFGYKPFVSIPYVPGVTRPTWWTPPAGKTWSRRTRTWSRRRSARSPRSTSRSRPSGRRASASSRPRPRCRTLLPMSRMAGPRLPLERSRSGQNRVKVDRYALKVALDSVFEARKVTRFESWLSVAQSGRCLRSG